MSTTHTPGPFSVHTYSDIQATRSITSNDGRTWLAGAITIGAGEKMVGEVSWRSESSGYPAVDNEAEMRANAALFIASADLLSELREARTTLSVLRTQVMVEIGRGHEQWDGVPEKLKERLDAIDAAIAAATGGAA